MAGRRMYEKMGSECVAEYRLEEDGEVIETGGAEGCVMRYTPRKRRKEITNLFCEEDSEAA